MKRSADHSEHAGFTKQRQAVLDVIHRSDKHLTANEVFEDARRLLPGISFATVYNSLRYLKTEGLIAEVSFGTEAARYDRNLSRHDHAVCSDCGKLVDIEIPLPTALQQKAAGLCNFQTHSIELLLRGLCPDCSRKSS